MTEQERKEKRRQYNRKWKQEHKEHLRQYRLEHKEENSVYQKRWREANKEEVNRRKREYRALNLQKEKERARKYYEDNREKILLKLRLSDKVRKRKKEYNKTHKEQIKEAGKRCRERGTRAKYQDENKEFTSIRNKLSRLKKKLTAEAKTNPNYPKDKEGQELFIKVFVDRLLIEELTKQIREYKTDNLEFKGWISQPENKHFLLEGNKTLKTMERYYLKTMLNKKLKAKYNL